MKYILAVALLFLVAKCMADGGEANPPPGEGEGEKFTLSKAMGIIDRLMRFQKAVKDKFDSGEITKDGLKENLEKAVNQASDCFRGELEKSEGILKELSKEFQQIMGGGSGGTETEAGAESDSTGLMKIFAQFVQKLNKVFTNPEVKKEMRELGQKLKEAAKIARDCFANELKKDLPEDQFNLLVTLWKESKSE